MRLHILSDLHLEFEPFTPAAVDADAVVLAGDIHVGREGFNWAREAFPDRPVIYVLGNHEFYGQTVQKLIQELRTMASGTNIRVLENETFCLADCVFLGATLWTDFALNGNPPLAEVLAHKVMSDYRRIQVLPGEDPLNPSDTCGFHVESRRWLEERVRALRNRKFVIVTHHAPSQESVWPALRGTPFMPAFASEMSRFIAETGARLWIHGHIHRCCDYTVGKTRVLANPRGYPTEPRDEFEPGLLVEV